MHFHKQKCFRSPDVLTPPSSTKGYQSLKNTEQLGTIYQPFSSKFSQKRIWFEVFLNSNRSQIQSWFQAVWVLHTSKSRSKSKQTTTKSALSTKSAPTCDSFLWAQVRSWLRLAHPAEGQRTFCADTCMGVPLCWYRHGGTSEGQRWKNRC